MAWQWESVLSLFFTPFSVDLPPVAFLLFRPSSPFLLLPPLSFLRLASAFLASLGLVRGAHRPHRPLARAMFGTERYACREPVFFERPNGGEAQSVVLATTRPR